MHNKSLSIKNFKGFKSILVFLSQIVYTNVYTCVLKDVYTCVLKDVYTCVLTDTYTLF